MPRTLNRLSPLKVQKLKRKGLHADGGGLYLRISDSGTKAWMFRFGDGGKLRDMGLGPLHTINLPRARELARECRELRLQGIDPIAHRRAALAARRASDAKAMTFKQCADAFIASHEAGWSNALHRQQWANTLAQHIHPTLGALPVAAIDTALVLKAIEPIWKTIPETASRTRGRVEAVLDFAKARGYREGENPARWRGHLDHLLPTTTKIKKKKHHPALPYSEAGAFMATLREEGGTAARALEFLILCAVRTGDIIGNERDDKFPLKWAHIDLKERLWTVPSTKTETEHRVPLSDPAIKLLKEMRATASGDVVFGMERPAMVKAIKRINAARTTRGLPRYVDPKQNNRDVTVHGFRSTFRDWAAEQTNFPREVCEQALAHAIPGAAEAAYRRGDLLQKRRLLMQAWADYGAKPADGGEVVAIGRGR
jgi:integrase